MRENAVAVAMSGGVDSSVAALLLREQGWDCQGVTLRLREGEGALLEAADAQAVAASLGMEFRLLDFREIFRRQVMDRFAAAYARGETPNPCLDCNRYVKFGALVDWAREQGFSKVASGHYARVERDRATGRWLLKKGLDQSKDQSYVLYGLGQEQLSRLLLPLGELTKEQVRERAGAKGFVNAHKGDSQDICFVPDGNYAAVVEELLGRSFPPGDFVGTQGQVYGPHRGIIHYTVGQRKGLGLSFPQPMYVCALRPEENQVVLGAGEELFARRLRARDLNLIDRESLEEPLEVTAKIRYGQREQPATAVQTGPDTLEVVFREPQRAITKGQAVVLYRGDTVVGGGTIC